MGKGQKTFTQRLLTDLNCFAQSKSSRSSIRVNSRTEGPAAHNKVTRAATIRGNVRFYYLSCQGYDVRLLAVDQWTQKSLKVLIDGFIAWAGDLAIADVVWVTGVAMTHKWQQ
jgi:hypothetical protein